MSHIETLRQNSMGALLGEQEYLAVAPINLEGLGNVAVGVGVIDGQEVTASAQYSL